MHLAHLTLIKSYIVAVTSAQRRAVCSEVFGGGDQSETLIAVDPSLAQFGAEIGVFAETLFTAAPARVDSDVEHR